MQVAPKPYYQLLNVDLSETGNESITSRWNLQFDTDLVRVQGQVIPPAKVYRLDRSTGKNIPLHVRLRHLVLGGILFHDEIEAKE